MFLFVDAYINSIHKQTSCWRCLPALNIFIETIENRSLPNEKQICDPWFTKQKKPRIQRGSCYSQILRLVQASIAVLSFLIAFASICRMRSADTP